MSDQRTLGEHGALIERLLAEQVLIRADLDTIKRLLSERNGERRVMLWAGSVVGGIVVGIFSLGLKVITLMLSVAKHTP